MIGSSRSQVKLARLSYIADLFACSLEWYKIRRQAIKTSC